MTTTDHSHFIPRSLDDGGKFLFWETDVAAVALLGMLLGIATEMPVLGLVLGLSLAYLVNKLKAGKHPGMVTHLLYWFTGFPTPKELPGAHIRELNG